MDCQVLFLPCHRLIEPTRQLLAGIQIADRQQELSWIWYFWLPKSLKQHSCHPIHIEKHNDRNKKQVGLAKKAYDYIKSSSWLSEPLSMDIPSSSCELIFQFPNKTTSRKANKMHSQAVRKPNLTIQIANKQKKKTPRAQIKILKSRCSKAVKSSIKMSWSNPYPTKC